MKFITSKMFNNIIDMTDSINISTLDSDTINNAISNMSDKELCDILSTLTKEAEVDILIKCDNDSLDKIYKIKRENVENLITRGKDDIDDEMKRVIECIAEFESKDNHTVDDYIKISVEMKWMISELKKDIILCEKDISSLEQAYQKMIENLFMYKDDLCDESLKVCKEKIHHTEGLIRLRYKTIKNNNNSINVLEHIVESISTNNPVY